jgi:hypothetical protein
MEIQLFKTLKRSATGIALVCLPAITKAQLMTDSLLYTGSMQVYTVPCGVNSITIKAWGAEGATGATGGLNSTGGIGGKGGYAEGTLSVTPGQQLYVYVGGKGSGNNGGFNGGANGGGQNAGGGGGATDVRVTSTSISNRIIVAGGGGGGGRAGCEQAGVAGGNGGFGGGGNGQDGNSATTSGGQAGGGFGAIGTAGGAQGIGCGAFLGNIGSPASNENGGTGGGGQTCCCFSAPSIPGGGGGGGGYLGGGGGGGGSAGTAGCSGNDKGAGGGGAGGTSYTSGVSNGISTPDVRLGDGKVIISYNNPLAATTLISPANSICSNAEAIFQCNTVSNATSYVWNVNGGLSIVSGQGTNSVTIKSVSGVGALSVSANTPCGATISSNLHPVSLNASPVATLTATVYNMCTGTPSILSGLPLGGSYSVVSGITSALNGNLFNASSVGTYKVAYSYTNALGCSDSAQVTLNVNCVLGINTLSNSEIVMSLNPNPTNGLVSVEILNATFDKATLKVLSMNGQLLETIQYNGKRNIDLSKYASGMYYLNVSNDQLNKTVKLVKE